MLDFMYIQLYYYCKDYTFFGGDGVAKTGRPKVENPRSEKMYIRLTTEEKETLEQYASKHGLSKTQVIVKGIRVLSENDQK